MLSLGMRFFLLALALFPAPLAFAQQTWQHYDRGRIRVYYQTEGPAAVLSRDENDNRIPDPVEDAALQVEAMHKLMVEALGFPDPFKSKRFSPAKRVEIFILGRDRMRVAKGIAFDELQRAKDEPKGVKSIRFWMAADVEPHRNGTPAHEYFHLIQYGNSYFKNSWYAEGTARWAEGLLGKASGTSAESTVVWPLTSGDVETLNKRSYAAATEFFLPLLHRFNREDDHLPDHEAVREVEAMRYANGTPVLRAHRLAGWPLIKQWFERLNTMDEVAFRELGYDRWSEANQFSTANTPYLLKALGEVLPEEKL